MQKKKNSYLKRWVQKIKVDDIKVLEVHYVIAKKIISILNCYKTIHSRTFYWPYNFYFKKY